MKVVEFHHARLPYAAGERAGFNDAVADRFARAGVAKIVPVEAAPASVAPAPAPITQAKVVRTAPRKG